MNYRHEIIEDRYIKNVVGRVRILFHIEDLIESCLIEEKTQDTDIKIHGLLEDSISRIMVYGCDIAESCRYRDIYEGVEIVFNCGKGDGYTISEIYRFLELKIVKNIIENLSKYLSHDREYLMMILLNGIIVLLEGFERSITIPSLEDILFVAHTHPRTWQPVFSRRDLIATLDVISKRGLGSCVVAVGGTLCILRERALTVEEYEKFELLINSISVATRDTLEMVGFKTLYILSI